VKVRIDKLLVERGLVPSRERAQALILAGKVLVNEQKLDKAGTSVPTDATIRLLGEDIRYVGRGGLKLEHALRHWVIDVQGRTCADIGTSTGGFTDCLLQHGAAHVIAIDTGYGQIDLKLRNDPRVHLLERTNARYLTNDQTLPILANAAIGEPVTFIAMDVSFISATLVLPAVITTLLAKARELPVAQRMRVPEMVVLVKPQFEVGRENIEKGGIVRNAKAQEQALDKVRSKIEELGATKTSSTDSPILGAEGNREFLLYGRFE
jgi:23S rRNA (cytidine1920-2'-O)/16S rRNA (cytidine1409-2'-O)-methyltransferase